MEDTALVITLAMVVAMALPAMATGAGGDSSTPKYTITVTNSNESVSIKGQTFTAYKLFENTYAGMSDNPYEGNNTVFGLDSDPHSYYIKKGSPFFDADSVELVETPANSGVYTYQLKSSVTGTAKDASPLAQILEYFVLTEMPGEANKTTDEQLVLVQPKTNKVGDQDVSTFTADKAYELAQKMAPIIESLGSNLDAWKVSATADGETVEINADSLGAGYYLVTGGGKAYKEGDTDGTATGDTVTAAVALTTTDPKAQIIAKLDAPKVVKTINESGTPKYNNKGVGDTVPYVVTTDVPNMTGYEKYFFIMNDTLSKGLTLNDNNATATNGVIDNVHKDTTDTNIVDNGFEVVITTKGGTSYTLTRVENHAQAVAKQGTGEGHEDYVSTEGNRTFYVEKDANNNSFEVVFHNMIQYKGNLIVDDTAADPTKTTGPFSTYDYRTLDVTQDKVGTYYSEFDGATITIKYSATVNEDAIIGETGNVNTAKLEYSNKPDKNNSGTPGDEDKPGQGEGFDNVTEISPESKAVTYVTGLKLLKYSKNGSDKNPLKDAEFTLVGQNLRNLVKKTEVIYREPKATETADVYELTGNRFTKTAPTADVVYNASNANAGEVTTIPANGKVVYGTQKEYKQFDAATGKTEVTTVLGDKINLYYQVQDAIVPTLVEDSITSFELKVFVKDEAGTYYLLKDGTYTQKAPGDEGAPANNAYESTTQKYKEETTPWNQMTIEQKEATTVTQRVKTDENGILLFRGLQAGEYTLTEISAPEGYNLLKQPIEIKVEWEPEGADPKLDQTNTNVQDTDTCTWKISYRNKGESAWTEITSKDTLTTLFELDVENLAGTELPSTGGIGTTIFYVMGAILVIGAGVILITRRRMDA